MGPEALYEQIMRMARDTSQRRIRAGEAEDLAALIDALDEWIRKGGALPRAWQRKRVWDEWPK